MTTAELELLKRDDDNKQDELAPTRMPFVMGTETKLMNFMHDMERLNRMRWKDSF